MTVNGIHDSIIAHIPRMPKNLMVTTYIVHESDGKNNSRRASPPEGQTGMKNIPGKLENRLLYY